MIDLVVVGGGPAGLATSIFAAKAGMRVQLVERGSLPLDKPCGEGLMPSGVDVLEQMAIPLHGFREFDGIRYVDAGRVAEARFASRRGLAVRRRELSRALTERARELGVEILERTSVLAIRDDGAFVRVARQQGGAELCVRRLVGADGLHSRIRRAARLEGSNAGHARRRFGVRRHYRLRPWSSFVEVHWANGGEAYVTLVGENEIGVALLWHEPPASYEHGLARFPDLAARLDGAAVTSSLKGAGPFRQNVSSVHRGNVALVGDAAGYLDALTGEALGLRSARALIASLCSGGGFREYEARYRKLRRGYDIMTELALVLTQHPSLRRFAIAFLASCPRLFSALVAVSSGESHRIERTERWDEGGLHVGKAFARLHLMDDRDGSRGLVHRGSKR